MAFTASLILFDFFWGLLYCSSAFWEVLWCLLIKILLKKEENCINRGGLHKYDCVEAVGLLFGANLGWSDKKW